MASVAQNSALTLALAFATSMSPAYAETVSGGGDADIVVTGLRSTTTVAKQGVEIRDLPQAITIVPKEVLDTAAARRFEDITYVTVGLTPYVPFGGASSSGGFSRGFSANQLIDGHVQAFAGFTSGLAVVDRVEVLRGPTSVLYGQGDPGGSINLVLKRANPVFGLAASGTVDSTGTRLADFDVTGPIAGDRLSARLVAQGEYSTTFRDFEKNRRVTIAPMIHAEPWAGATIDVLGSYDRYEYTAIRDYLVFDPVAFFSIDTLKSVPLSRNFSEPTLPLSRLDTWTFSVNAEQKLSGHWAVGGSFYSYLSLTKAYYELVTTERVAGSQTLRTRSYTRAAVPNDDFSRSRTGSIYVKGDADLWGTKHKIYVGAETLFNDLQFNDLSGDYLPIDTANPVYQPRFVEPATSPSNHGGQNTSTKAIYANDLIAIGSRLNVQLGLRYDWIKTTATFGPVPAIFHDRKLSPSAGIVWHPADATSLYGSYSTSFVPQAGLTQFNTPLKPERSTAYEIGLKQELFDRRLAVTLAVFDITKDGVLQTDPGDPTGNSVINGGTARSQGFELEFEGSPPVEGMSIRGGVSYANARITKSTDYTPGDKLVGGRPWTALLSVRQQFDRLGVPGLWLEASGYYGGSQESAIPANGQVIPAFTRIDLAAGKRFGPIELQLNLKNLTNDRIFINNGGGRVVFDNPRSVGATLRYRLGSLR